MNIEKRFKPIFKITVIVVIFFFLAEQIVWAGDLQGALLDDLTKAVPEAFAPEYLRNQQSIHESMIARKQVLEDGIIADTLSASPAGPSEEEVSLELKGPKAGDPIHMGVLTSSAAILEEGPSQGSPRESDEESGGDEDPTARNGAVLSVKTKDGTVVHYLDGAINFIETKDGAILRDLVINEDNTLSAADITYADGTHEIISSGKALRVTKPDGSVTNYNEDGSIASIAYPGDKITVFAYRKDSLGSVIETTLTDSDKTAYYGSDNKLRRVEFNSGKLVEYESGAISKIVEADGGIRTFDITANTDETITSVVKQYDLVNGYSVKFSGSGSIESLISPNNNILYYSSDMKPLNIEGNGFAVKFNDKSRVSETIKGAEEIKYFYSEDPDGNMISSTLRVEIKRISAPRYNAEVSKGILIDDENYMLVKYDSDGNLVSVGKNGYIVTAERIHELTLLLEAARDEAEPSIAAYRTANEAYDLVNQHIGDLIDAKYDIERQRDAERDKVYAPGSLEYYISQARIRGYCMEIARHDMYIREAQNSLKIASDNVRAVTQAWQNAMTRIRAAEICLDAARDTFNHYPKNIRSYDHTDGLLDIDINKIKTSLPFLRVTYDDTLAMKEMVTSDGSIVNYKDALPDSVMRGGAAIDYVYTLSDIGNVNTISVDRDGIKRIYDNYGNIKSLSLSDAATVVYENGKVSQINTSGGGTADNIVLDTNGMISSCDVTESDGTITYYIDSKIDRKVLTNGTILKYAAGRIDTSEDPDGKIYKYIYEEDSSGAISTIKKELIQYTLTNGAVLRIADGVTTEARLADGLQLISPAFDKDGKIISASFIRNDGAAGSIKDGLLESVVLSDGTVLYYQDNYIKRAVREDGSALDYSYSFDSGGNISEIRVNGLNEERVYDASLKLIKTLSDTRVVEYKGDSIKSIYTYENDVLIQDPVFTSSFTITDGVIKLANGTFYTFENGINVSDLIPDGVRINYGADNLIRSIIKPGFTEEYTYNRDASGLLTSIDVRHNRVGEWMTEELSVYLKRVTDSFEHAITNSIMGAFYYTLSRNTDTGRIDCIDRRFVKDPDDEKTAFEVRYEYLASTTNMVISAPLYYGNGYYFDRLVTLSLRKDANMSSDVPIEISFYSGSTLIRREEVMDLSADWQERAFYFRVNSGGIPSRIEYNIKKSSSTEEGSGKFYISDISCLQIKSFEGRGHWKNSVTPEASVTAKLMAREKDIDYKNEFAMPWRFREFEISEYFGATPLHALYDSGDKLKEIKRANGTIVNFALSKPENMIEPEGGMIGYEYDGAVLKKAFLFPEAGLSEPDVVLEYSGNKICRAVKGDRIYRYSYEYGPDDKEIVAVTDESTNYVYRYQGGILISSMSEDGLFTEYSYKNKRVDKAWVRFNEKLLEIFSYEYADTFTIVVDEKGVKRTYDANNRLIFLETSDGLGYVYNYAADDAGNDVLEAELHQSRGIDGTIVYHKSGNIDSVQLKDGTILNIDDSGDDASLQNITINDGLINTVTYQTGEVATYIRDHLGRFDGIMVEKDGVKRWYNTDGELLKLQSSPNEYYLYGYVRSGTGSITNIKISKVTLDTIGAALPPVKLCAFSAGYDDGWDAGIMVSDRAAGTFNTNWWAAQYNETWNGRGYDVAVVDQSSGKVLKAELFDVYGKGESEADRMAAFIGSVKDGDYVLIAVGDEGSVHMTENAFSAIETLGSAMIRGIADRSSWAMIGRKGAAAGTVPEGLSSRGNGPVILSGYSQKSFYYDKDGLAITLNEFYDTPDTSWLSARPTHFTDELEVFSYNSDGDISGYIKNFNPEYANSGFIRLWDEINDRYTDEKMADIEKLIPGKEAKAIYFDSRYPSSWTLPDYSAKMVEYFKERGYSVLNADELKDWLTTNGANSVVIMAQDVAPATIINKYTSESPVRAYLEAGGTYVWMHDIPFHYIGYSDGSRYDVGEIGERKVLGVITAIAPRTGEKYTIEDCVIASPGIPDDQPVIDMGILYFDSSVNYRDIDWHKIKDSIGYELKADTAVVSEYDSGGKIISIAKADKTVSVYRDDRVDFVTDIHGDIVVDYSYDASGNITAISMIGARRDMGYKADEVKFRIAEEKVLQLEDLARQKGLIAGEIISGANSQRAALVSQRSQVERQLSELEGRNFWGSSQKRQKSIAMDQMRANIVAINNAIQGVNAEESRQLAALDSEVDRVAREIDESAEESLVQVDIEIARLLLELSLEEVKPVICEYYRGIIGRDPSEAEITYWVNDVKLSRNQSLDITNLKDHIYNSDEYIAKTNSVASIRGDIESALRGYIAMTPEEKQAFLLSYNLTLSEAVTLSSLDLDAINAFLASQDIHFGRSAANIIGNLLTDDHIEYVHDDIIRSAIVIDIVTGVINKFSKGTLLISAFALKKVASLYDLELTSVRMSFDTLKSMSATSSGSKITVLINEDHYVMVTDIDTENNLVTYIETSKGPAGESVHVTIDEFKDAWKGCYALIKESPPSESVILSDYEAQKVRGACFPFIIAIIVGIFNAAAFTIASVATAVIAIANLVIVPLVKIALDLIVSFVAVLAQGIGVLGKALFVGVQHVGLSLFKGFASFIAGNIAGAGATASMTTSAVAFISKSIVTTAVSFGINAGLDALGVNPIISRSISAFMTGGIAGAIGDPASGFFSISQAFGALAIQGVCSLGPEINLPQPITDALAISLGAIVDGIFTIGTNIPVLFTNVATNLLSEFAYIGITKAGELLGVDPRISYLAGVGLRSTLQTGLSSEMDPGKIWNSVSTGLLQGVASIGLNFVTEELDLNPLFANIGFSVISGAINSSIQALTGGSQNVFTTLFETYKNNALTFLGYSDPNSPGYAWQQAAYMSQVLDFSDIVKEKGLVDALNMYGASFFNSVAVNAIVESGASLGEYFAERLQTGQYKLETKDGKQYKSVEITDKNGNPIGDSGLFEDITLLNGLKASNLVGRSESSDDGLFFGLGDVGIDSYGKAAFKNAVIETLYDDIHQTQTIENGQQIYVGISDKGSDRTLITIMPSSEDSYNIYSGDGTYSAVEIKSDDGKSIIVSDGEAEEYRGARIFRTSTELLYSFIPYTTPNGSNSNGPNITVKKTEKGSDVSINFSNISDSEKQEIINYYMVMNGIGNKDYYNSPRYIYSFSDKLNAVSPGRDDIALIPMFNDKMPRIDADSLEDVVGYQKELLFDNLKYAGYIESDGTLKREFYDLSDSVNMSLYDEFEEKRQMIYDFLANLSKSYFDNINDIIRDVSEWCGQTTYIANQIYSKMFDVYKGILPSDMTGLCYSGSGDPFIYMLNTHSEINVNSIVLVGTPIKGDRWVYNTNVNTVVTLYGENDDIFLSSNTILRKDFLPSKSRLFEKNPRPLNEVVIKLKGIGHTDYFYDPKNPGSNPALQQKAAEFIAGVTAKAKDAVALQQFFETTEGIVKDALSGKYVIDLERIQYDD